MQKLFSDFHSVRVSPWLRHNLHTPKTNKGKTEFKLSPFLLDI